MALLNVNEAAELLRLHPQTVRRLARTGRIPAMRVGRVLRFEADDLRVPDLRPSAAARGDYPNTGRID